MMGLGLAFCLVAAQTAVAQNGMLQAGTPTLPVAASAGTVTIPITRVAGTSGVVGCTYTTIDGTAVAGVDYTFKTGTLSWADGDSAPKNVTVSITDHAGNNPDKTFYLQLTLPTGGAYLGVPPSGKNHEGRSLGTYTSPPGPIDWNSTTGTTGDSILQTLQIMPANNPWNEDITGLPVSPESSAIIGFMGAGTHIHVNRDMNLTIVKGNQTLIPAARTLYASESDPPNYPIPTNLPIEGFLGDDGRTVLADIQQDINPGPQGGDRHATIIDPDNGFIYEFGNMSRDAAFAWTASGEATFNMRSNVTRQAGWTSTDAAGLPILPSITRYDECQRGMVEHAIRVTASASRGSYVWPATHQTTSYTGTDRPRMGERFRLRESAAVNAKIALMGTHAKAIALAMKKYGMFMADNGSNWYISTNSDNRLNNLNDIQSLVGSDFDVVVTTDKHEGIRSTSTSAITITDGGGGGGGDSIPPIVTITGPSKATTYTTSISPLAFTGTATDAGGVASVQWTNSTGTTGATTGSPANWTASVPLAIGSNVVTIAATDAGGNIGIASLTVQYTGPAPASGGSAGGGGGGGGCGLSGLELLPLLLFRRFRRHD